MVSKNRKKEIRVTVGGKKRTGRNKFEEHLVIKKVRKEEIRGTVRKFQERRNQPNSCW